MGSSLLGNILHQITVEKLAELDQRRDTLDSHFLPILHQLDNHDSTSNPMTSVEKLNLLHTALKSCPLQDCFDAKLVSRGATILNNCGDDRCMSDELLAMMATRIREEIQFVLRRGQFSFLYASLLGEWLGLEGAWKEQCDGETTPIIRSGNREGNQDEKNKTLIKDLGDLMLNCPKLAEFNPEKFRTVLTKDIFKFGSNVDDQNPNCNLSPQHDHIIHQIFGKIGDCFPLNTTIISNSVIKTCIHRLLSTDLLSPQKKSVLKELLEHQNGLQETSNLLTNRLKNLSRWTWPAAKSAVRCSLRRGLNGEYAPYLEEDIFTAIFLQFIGMKWGVWFRQRFFALTVQSNTVWSREDCTTLSIEEERWIFYYRNFFSTLPISMSDQKNAFEEEYVKVQGKTPQQIAAQLRLQRTNAQVDEVVGIMRCNVEKSLERDIMDSKSSSYIRNVNPYFTQNQANSYIAQLDSYSYDLGRKAPLRQALIHIISTEIKLNTTLYPRKPFFIVQSEIQLLYSTIPHAAVLITLEVLGLPSVWLHFFKKFLTPKVRFETGISTDTEEGCHVQRGLPMGHTISDLFAEILLFLLALYVNQQCSPNPIRLYKVDDEIWFWGRDEAIMKKCWHSITNFLSLLSLKPRDERSGSVTVYSSEEYLAKFKNTASLPATLSLFGPAPLPQRTIHWGYLQISSSSHLIIDTSSLSQFVEEMRQQLSTSPCTLSWISAFNKYMRFFVGNFGQSSVSTGVQHLDQILKALETLFSSLFGRRENNLGCNTPVHALKEKFPLLRINLLPDGWVYWPLEKGGLGLHNPFIRILALKQSIQDRKKTIDFEQLPETDKLLWEEVRKSFGRGLAGVTIDGMMRLQSSMQMQAVCLDKVPSTFSDYVARRENQLVHWRHRYVELLEVNSVGGGDAIQQEQSCLVEYYDEQLVAFFGRSNFINDNLLPMQMIAEFKQTKVRF